MALKIKTANPEELLSDIKKAIDSKEIQTWIYDGDGDFTHSPDQWKYKAWMSPKIVGGELHFGFIGNKNENTTRLLYAVFHGRFSEMLLTHFDYRIETILSTAMPTPLDRITTLNK